MPHAPESLQKDLPELAPTPAWLRAPWPALLLICLAAIVIILSGFNPLGGADSAWTDLLLRLRSSMGMSPAPDRRIFLVALEDSDFSGASTTAAEYHLYAQIIRMLSDLRASVIALDVILVRGGPVEANEVQDAIRRSNQTVLAEALGEQEIMRSFPFSSPEFPGGLINIEADADGVHRRYKYGFATAQR
jgi:CHASE2 domain-containing sensor protein